MQLKRKYLEDVGYKSTVAAFTIFTAMPQHINAMNADTCISGKSRNIHAIPLAPHTLNNETNKIKRQEKKISYPLKIESKFKRKLKNYSNKKCTYIELEICR